MNLRQFAGKVIANQFEGVCPTSETRVDGLNQKWLDEV